MALNTLSSKLVEIAIPHDSKPQRTFKMSALSRIMSENLNRDIYVFDLNFNNAVYAVSLMAAKNQLPWLLVFNHKHVANQKPLVFKIFPGYLIEKYYTLEDKNHIENFFNISLSISGSVGNFLEKINENLIFRRNSETDLDDRTALLSLQDNPEEADKIYFKAFKRNKGIKQNGDSYSRSVFNSWKTQTLLPWVWEQIKNDSTISVIYTTESDAKYSLIEEERQLLEQKIRELKHL
ncbi:DUF6037 family protein [Weissella viridescens]|uniref:DUF6037 family protein n=1 Tax=Weissella viridescens TaxID=1629 RepID=UPI003AF28CFA